MGREQGTPTPPPKANHSRDVQHTTTHPIDKVRLVERMKQHISILARHGAEEHQRRLGHLDPIAFRALFSFSGIGRTAPGGGLMTRSTVCVCT